jgi:SAM-dependent methyltransferase
VDWSGELQLAVRREAANVVGQAELATSATFYEARAETLPFADESFGLVICGQAFHWFDAARTLHEIERVLAPGGAHAQFWKHQLPDDPYAKAADDLERSMSGRKPGDMFEPTWERLRDVWRSCGLVDRRRIELDIGLPFTVESFVGYESSRESLRLALGERRFEYLAELRRMIAAMAPAGGAFEVRAKEYLFLARRRPPA